ncbi:MAG: UDP-N-acetylmuramoyl-L-alanine--D-glutamate ligase [Myxococcales bacterium]|nr:UDP-N-acetylmuramoyl-L-alanine--D-glutamate ligase [Myxococcales bacterium]
MTVEPALRDPLPDVERVTIWGAGWTGVCAANLLRRFGKQVTLTDTREPDVLQAALARLAPTALADGVAIHHGEHDLCGAQAIVMTQSVRPSDHVVAKAQAARLPVIPEVELANRALEGVTVLSIGGTDGKTTTTKLVGHLVGAQRHALIGGNSWLPLSGAAPSLVEGAPEGPHAPVLVSEISAFQLPPWHGFRPQIAAVTNVAEDHVQEFFQGSLQAYIAAKRALTDRLERGDTAVLNVDDPIVRGWEPALVARGVRVVRTSLTSRAVGDHPWAVFRNNGELRTRWEGREERVVHQDAIPLLGDHNIENTLTALGAVMPLGLDVAQLREALTTFEPPHHRLERVATWRGVGVYDDSKATNTHAAMVGLSAFGSRSLIVIVGGVDKGLDLDAWVESLRSRARRVVVIGGLRERLLAQYGERLPQAQPAESLDEAVAMALSEARPDEVVVLSPACSSFDMFASYADRGRQFQGCVARYIAAQGGGDATDR